MNTVTFHPNEAYGFWTTSLFWDCSCDGHYIHERDESNPTKACEFCGDRQDFAPDSRVREVIQCAVDFDLPMHLVEELIGTEEGRALEYLLSIPPVKYEEFYNEKTAMNYVKLMENAVEKLVLMSTYLESRMQMASHARSAKLAIGTVNTVRKALGFSTKRNFTF